MATAEELDKKLAECCEQLVDCTSIISEISFEPKKANIYRIGKAIFELSQLRSELFKVHPHLKPEKWDQPPSDEDFAEMYQTVVMIADEHLSENRPGKAIETYESYVSLGPCEKYEILARAQIEKIRGKHGV